MDFVWRKVCEALGQILTKKFKRPITVKPSDLRELLTLVIDVVAHNPSFTSQTKDRLDSSIDKVGLSRFCSMPREGLNGPGSWRRSRPHKRTRTKIMQKTIKTDRGRSSHSKGKGPQAQCPERSPALLPLLDGR